MNELELKYYKALYEKRKNWTKTLLDYEARGVWVTIIDKYTDPVHFIYELLQNADDANATKVFIRLEKDGFVFRHNGSTHFTISDPDKAEEDDKRGKYGHLNSLTGIGSSTKPSDVKKNKIGKFGIGFKSVFKYTDHPHIYDDIICFALYDYVVPELLTTDHPLRNSGETLFYLPFDKANFSKKQAYSEIEEKLKTLDNPILFLHNIQEIEWESATSKGGTYSKELLKSQKYKDVVCENIKLHNFSVEDTKELWMFTRKIQLNEGRFPISVGLYIKDGKIDTTARPKVFCFFPTRESLDLCFVMHAPFALIDNREAIKETEAINDKLFEELAILASDALLALRDIGIKEKNTYIDESIFQIVPLSSKYAYDIRDKWYNKFFYHFKDLLTNADIHRAQDGSYVCTKHALKIDNTLRKLLSEDQGSDLLYFKQHEYYYSLIGTHREKYKYVHINLALRRSENFVYYFNLIGLKTLYLEDFVNKFTKRFIQHQSDEWLEKFYHFLTTSGGQKLLIEGDEYDDDNLSLRNKPIIRDSNGEFLAPYNGNEVMIFTPDEGEVDGIRYVDKGLLSNPDFIKVLELLGISTPDIHDIIENSIFPKYEDDYEVEWEEYEKDFKTIFKAYKSSKSDYFIQQVRDNFPFRSTDDYLIEWKRMRKDTHVLKQLLSDSDTIYVLDSAYYEKLVPQNQLKLLREFLDKLEFETILSVVKIDGVYKDVLSEEDIKSCKGVCCRYIWVSNRECKEYYLANAEVSDYQLESFEDIISNGKINKEFSILYWNSYKTIVSLSSFKWSRYKNWECTYSPYNDRRYSRLCITKDSSFITQAHSLDWLYDRNGDIHAPNDIYIEDLAPEYELNDEMISFLGLQYSPQSQDHQFISENCSESARDAYEFGKWAQNNGINVKDKKALDRLAKLWKEEEKREQEAALEEERRKKKEEEKAKLDKLRKDEKGLDAILHKQNKYSTEELFDEAPQNLPTRNSSKQQSNVLTEEQLAELQQQEETRKNLEEIAQDVSKRYTYEWFNALLELEFRKSGEANKSKSGLHIIFSKVEKDPHSERGVLLRNPSRYIPRSIEECTNITVVFYLPNDIHPSISFEVASVQDYVLRLKCKNEDIEAVDNLLAVAHQVYRAELKTDTPIKLIERLQAAYTELGYEDDFSMLENLNPTTKFVFGPPGTGKTTYLVKKWINKIATHPTGKMLVLCPTNKAADVIAQRALEKINPAAHPETWIYRFVQTAEDALENHVCLRDSSIYKQDKCCVISTIARFAYDGFEGAKLKDIDWDVIVIDEASMIPLAEIVYPLYKCENAQVVIAGDPFQIEPIVAEELWKEENIYKMIRLDNFQHPHTVPCDFDIVNLDTQYRAVPAIGRLYSEYAYDGAINSYRKQDSQRPLKLKGFNPKSVNFVMFPVNRTSIYEPHVVVNSNVHIYSALFAYEFIKYLASNIETQQDEKPWRIGVISPYRAQAEIINKLWEQRTELYNNVDVQIGTVHGFQGDECDIIVAVYNPPARGMKRNAGNVFVNKKNILNVAISRAQDYLFLLMPDGDYEDYNNLETKTIGVIAKKDTTEMTVTNSQVLEKVIHGDSHYLDKNTFVTVHQLANVYSDPSSKYEVRFDEKSVDIQIK